MTPAATHATDPTLWRQLAATWRVQPCRGAVEIRGVDETSIGLIRASFAQVVAIASPAAILFHGHLFRIDPSTEAVFRRADMRAQGASFIAALGLAVATLGEPERLRPVARGLARRLAARGLRAEHFASIGAALDWMLEECLAEDFTPVLRAAWSQAYREVTAAMTGRDFRALAA